MPAEREGSGLSECDLARGQDRVWAFVPYLRRRHIFKICIDMRNQVKKNLAIHAGIIIAFAIEPMGQITAPRTREMLNRICWWRWLWASSP